MPKILLNDEEYDFKWEEIPCLITYAEKSGGSHFTIKMVADLFLKGEKILFLTAYPMAKDNFMEQIKGEEGKVAYITNIEQLDESNKAIILESGNGGLFLDVIKKLSDMNERVVLIKNMEVFGEEVLAESLKINNLIFSGDLDKCVAKDKALGKTWQTIIAFTKPQTDLPFEIPILEKYTGYLWGEDKKGIVKIK